jgi:hypothetical protein
VGRWIKVWLQAWRSEPVVLLSPLPVSAARKRLLEGHVSYLRAFFIFGGGGGYLVVGHIGRRRILLEALQLGGRNSWQPVLHARLEPAGNGCRLVGRLGWSRVVKTLCALLLGGAVGGFLGLLIRAVARAVNGDATGGDFLIGLIPLSFVPVLVVLTSWGARLGRSEANYLRSWLVNRLQTAGSAIPGYRPWTGTTPR